MNDNINENETKKKSPMKNKKALIPLLLLLAVVVIGTSFALWQLTFTQNGTNVITTGCLKLTLTEDTDAINITDAVPTTDIDGKNLDPFTFTLENVCTTEASYVVNLETVSSGDKILADNYVKANLVSGENELFIDNLLETHINEEKVIEEATTAYKLHQGKLGNKEKISFSLRLWMDETTPADDAVMEALWQGKITVTAQYVPPVNTKNMMVAMEVSSQFFGHGYNDYEEYYNLTYSQNDKYDVSRVVYQAEINPYNEATEIVDFSEAKDRSVLGYYVKNEDNEDNNTYTLYIQANGKIKVNQTASYLGLIRGRDLWVETSDLYGVVDGIENLDTSLVTDMSNMFFLSSKETLDLSHFDTTNVTNMQNMFYGMINLTNLNLSGFKTKNVTSMNSMFKLCSNLTNLNLNSFDTSQVTTMENMFAIATNLTTIDYGSNFVHKDSANINSMFNSCPANKPTDSTWSGVTF